MPAAAGLHFQIKVFSKTGETSGQQTARTFLLDFKLCNLVDLNFSLHEKKLNQVENTSFKSYHLDQSQQTTTKNCFGLYS